MSVAKKCDICGKFYEPDADDRFVNLIIKSIDKTLKAVEYTKVDVDICPECLDAVMNLLKERGYRGE